ncbi:MAG: aminotransferase class I/II-fold pyridoxal phosphate-dependent enzyme [Sphaerochaetaceae bacterium]|nr:aminotransferase class I/II-fold pyridoxal phosphate-dependent enzyme [Sphaerochaetaceae bacterium]
MQAIILAAGMGKRLKELTKNNTKCMVEVNGVTLIERMLRQLDERKLSRIIIVTGYKGSELKEYVDSLKIGTEIVYIDNPVYDKTNNIYSLSLAENWLLNEDSLLFESDIIFDSSLLDSLLSDQRSTLALVDKFSPWMDGTCLKIGDNDEIREFISKEQFDYSETDEYYKTVNIYKFSKDFSRNYYVPFLKAYQEALGLNEYYEQVLRVIAMLNEPVIKVKRLNGQRWYEIDDEQDLDIAEVLFAKNPEEKLKRIESRYGGFWRFPQMLDFCYLVNPYFPPEKMKNELKASFETLLTQYPSGMSVNSSLGAKNFGVHKENIVVGNGAAELIKSLLGLLQGKTGFIRPTFEEYPNRYNADNSLYLIPDNPDFSYDAQTVIKFFSRNRVNNLVIVNPDNPSGNYINRNGILELIKWSEREGIKLIIDESFIDFAEEENSSIIDQNLLTENPHLFVMKSISKSYGVPGLRLGILASGNTGLISEIKKDVSIWNINSFAEYYLQIYEKYKNDYEKALILFKNERNRFFRELSSLPYLRACPSQANYIMVQISDCVDSSKLQVKLLADYNILVKSLKSKTGGKNYLRIAVRNTEDNNRLLKALREILSGTSL